MRPKYSFVIGFSFLILNISLFSTVNVTNSENQTIVEYDSRLKPNDCDFRTFGFDWDYKLDLSTEIGDAIQSGMIARRILDGIVKNRYRTNVGKLAAWLSAAHVERAAKRKESAAT